MEKCIFYLETSNDKELENSFLAYLEKETTEEDRLFAMSERGQELRKILGLSQKVNKKPVFPQANEIHIFVPKDDFMLKGYSGGVTESKYHQVKPQKNAKNAKINSKKLKYTF